MTKAIYHPGVSWHHAMRKKIDLGKRRLFQQHAGTGGNGWQRMRYSWLKRPGCFHRVASQSSTPAAAGKPLPGKRINFALNYLFIPHKKYYNTCPNTTWHFGPFRTISKTLHDTLKRLPWVGVFNEGFLCRPAFLSSLIYMPCRVSFSSPILHL